MFEDKIIPAVMELDFCTGGYDLPSSSLTIRSPGTQSSTTGIESDIEDSSIPIFNFPIANEIGMNIMLPLLSDRDSLPIAAAQDQDKSEKSEVYTNMFHKFFL